MELVKRIPGENATIARRTVRDQISDKLAYMIHSGLLRPGDELPSERELAVTLGVARESVRAAISVLQTRRMIEVSHGARTRVLGTGPFPLHESISALRELGDHSFSEVAEAREAVEVQVVSLAAQRITRKELARMAALVQEQESMLEDPVRFQISDREFHTTLYGACRNTLLVDVVSDFYDYALEYRRRVLRRPSAIAHSVAEHHGIVTALRTRSPEVAVAAMRKHLNQVRRTTRKEMGK
jgi:DNA-binding FadR family transcriptional regulator